MKCRIVVFVVPLFKLAIERRAGETGTSGCRGHELDELEKLCSLLNR